MEVAGEDDGAELHAQVADEQQKRDANRPPLGALVVDVNVGVCEIGAMPSTAHEKYLSDQGTWIGVHEKSTAQWCWVITWKFSARGTVSDETRPFLYANHMPRAIEVRSQQARIRTSCGSRIQEKSALI